MKAKSHYHTQNNLYLNQYYILFHKRLSKYSKWYSVRMSVNIPKTRKSNNQISKFHALSIVKMLCLFLFVAGFISCNEGLSTKFQSFKSKEKVAYKLFVSKNELDLRPNEGLVYHENKPFTGFFLSFYNMWPKQIPPKRYNTAKGLERIWQNLQ